MCQVGEARSSQVQQGAEAAQRVLREQAGKVEHAFAEAARFEGRGVARAKEGIDEMARLAKETIDCVRRLTGAARVSLLGY